MSKTLRSSPTIGREAGSSTHLKTLNRPNHGTAVTPRCPLQDQRGSLPHLTANPNQIHSLFSQSRPNMKRSTTRTSLNRTAQQTPSNIYENFALDISKTFSFICCNEQTDRCIMLKIFIVTQSCVRSESGSID